MEKWENMRWEKHTSRNIWRNLRKTSAAATKSRETKLREAEKGHLAVRREAQVAGGIS